MFRLFLVFALLASVVMGQQTMVLTFTFSSGTPGLTKQEGSICYNILSNRSDGYNGTVVRPVTGLQYTDGTETEIGVSVAPVVGQQALISKFLGDTTLFGDIFGDAVDNNVAGILDKSSTSPTALTLLGIQKGQYTLSVLAARGNVAEPNKPSTTYSLTLPDNVSAGKIEARVLAYNGDAPVIEGATVTSTIFGEGKIASNWALMQFSIVLEEDVEWLKLCANGNHAHIAAVAFTAVPEPTSVVFSLLSVIWVAGYRRRKYSH